MEDYYKILGVEKGASDAEIKSAFRKLAHKHHPDKATGDESKFKKINEAYQILSNKEKKSQYDRFGKTFNGGQGPGGFNWQDMAGQGFGFDPSQFEDAGNLNDIFDAFFEGMGVKRKRRAYERGSDLELQQEITLEEAWSGVEKQTRFTTFIFCTKCEGTGHFEKEGFTDCSSCDGRGEIQENRKTFFGNFAQVRECNKCKGLGKIPNKVCKTCSSSGRVEDEKTITITIVPGVNDGQVIKIAGAGERGPRGAEAGDLYIRIRVKSHARFRRGGDDLVMKERIQLITLLLEKKISIETISGKQKEITIPTDYRLGDPLILSGEGMPHLGRLGKGRLLVELEVMIPKKINNKARNLLEELRRELD